MNKTIITLFLLSSFAPVSVLGQNMSVHLHKGQKSPYKGILMTIPDAQTLLKQASELTAEKQACDQKIIIWKKWATNSLNLCRTSGQTVCKLRTDFLNKQYNVLAKQKNNRGIPVWAVVILGVGMLGLGIGLGVGLGLHYR